MEMSIFDSFCSCYELEGLIVEENGTISSKYIIDRNNKMWNIILKNHK
jgi:hypothetical protein